MSNYILAIDQGTTSTRAILFDKQGCVVNQKSQTFKQFYPQKTWVEHDSEEIWSSVLTVCREVINAYSVNDIAAIGISNQRETTVIWEKSTGKPIYHAIVWQDRRTADFCEQLKSHEQMIAAKTGLLLDPYFSASKIAWVLNNVLGAREKAEKGELLFGTIDTFIIWRLTNGKSHVTDATNASRTSLFNLHTQSWDEELLTLFTIPRQILPVVLDNCAEFGVTEKSILGKAIRITGVAGDQQAASFGQTCFDVGMMKVTYGTGGFMLLNTGNKIVSSQHRLLTTVAYRLQGKPVFALEGSIFMAGAIVDWLKNNLNIIASVEEAQLLAKSVESAAGVYFITAFTGMGAPYWAPHAQAAILGMTRDTQRAHIVRAALESVGYQTRDILRAMIDDGAPIPKILRVDGGMAENQWFLGFLSQVLGMQIVSAQNSEATSLGAAYLAGLQVGFYESLDQLAALWKKGNEFYLPTNEVVEESYRGWVKMVSSTNRFST
jgi:glycerol kinase